MHHQAGLVHQPDPPPQAGPAGSTAAIAAVFARVLGFGPVDDDGDFFALGGDSVMATALALELEAELGLELPVSILFDAPTPALLARALARRAAPGDARLVPLKPGRGRQAVFLVPGAGGWQTDFRLLAQQIDIHSPVYGFRIPGLDGVEPPMVRIEALAERFLPIIRAVQPHGPYLLGGYSMGGLTAFELAQLLTAAGEEVALLALFDTYISPRHLPWQSLLAVWRRRLAHHAQALRTRRRRAVPAFVLARCRSLLGDLGIFPRPSPGMPKAGDARLTPAMRRVIEASLAASVAYRPRFYPGALTYFEAADADLLPGYPELTWRPLARELAVHVVDGDHWQMLHRRCADTARQFSACVRAALLEKPARPRPAAITPGRARSGATSQGLH